MFRVWRKVRNVTLEWFASTSFAEKYIATSAVVVAMIFVYGEEIKDRFHKVTRDPYLNYDNIQFEMGKPDPDNYRGWYVE